MVISKASHGVFAARFPIASAVIAWAIALGIGLIVMARYENTPGTASASPATWPVGTSLARRGDRPTLVMFAHPRCPCSRASISQLAGVWRNSDRSATAYVVFYTPFGADSSWFETDIWRSASEMAGVTIVRDAGGVEATRFGVRTSGNVLVFDEAGSLIFEGGITGSRGHAGDNLGSNAVAALLLHEPTAVCRTPVFGCELFVHAACPLCDRKEAP